MSEITWQEDPEFLGANHAEHALIGDYELVVFDLPADPAGHVLRYKASRRAANWFAWSLDDGRRPACREFLRAPRKGAARI
jgi:hypothetical protein